MTLPVVAIFVAKPGLEEKLETLLRSVVEPTLREEGCISYQVNRDIANPRRFVFTEEWRSKADLDRHLATPHLRMLSEQIPALIESSDVILLAKVAGGPA
ncbi:antibiotic biosynthesis monooxygenase [Oxalobacteraceae sp. CFBP 8763]|nr:antibiotic biosynthesis monooxygenase [Oxalobacteraceae sp. CFBP 8763]